jgi:hypothetical protein
MSFVKGTTVFYVGLLKILGRVKGGRVTCELCDGPVAIVHLNMCGKMPYILFEVEIWHRALQ